MDYFQISFREEGAEKREILIAILSDINFDSFQETDDQLFAFIAEKDFDQNKIDEILQHYALNEISFDKNRISEKNWNKLWEQNFESVRIAENCRVLAPFHEKQPGIEYELIIEPQMSFGTAHHATTALMLQLMLSFDFENKSVLDMGCGTGILAILASKMKADKVIAIDNNIWAFQNTRHNMQLNHVENIDVLEGEKESIPEIGFDAILANINRNVLLEGIPAYVKHLKNDGLLFLSGYLKQDSSKIADLCKCLDLRPLKRLERDEWVAEVYQK